MNKVRRNWEKQRRDRASSVLSSYSNTLATVMKKLPMNKLSPSFRNSGAAILHSQRNREKKTFFKGATSFFLQAESSLFTHKNDAAIRTHLGIEGRKTNQTKDGPVRVSDKNIKPSYKGEDDTDDGEMLDPRDFTKSVLEDCNAVLRPHIR